ncbi:MAG: hypothetical protein ACW99F_10580 [Candidatus Hodarchaeales archaeon]
MPSIAVKTDDMRFYYRLLKLSQKSPLKINFYSSTQQIPKGKYDLVIYSYKESPKEHDNHTFFFKYEELTAETIPMLIGLIARNYHPKFQKMIIGVDPGDHIGIATICDGMLLHAETVDIHQLVHSIEKLILMFPAEMVVLRIGDQPDSISNLIFNKIYAAFNKIDFIQLEIVNETSSSLKSPVSKTNYSSDEKSAIIIGLREGKTRNHMVRNDISLGRIKEIQKRSRKETGNLTLDVKLAESVAHGILTMEEAILIKRKEKLTHKEK